MELMEWKEGRNGRKKMNGMDRLEWNGPGMEGTSEMDGSDLIKSVGRSGNLIRGLLSLI